MEIVKLDSTTYQNGQIINGIEKKLWVERYREPGEFEFTAKASSSLRTDLPIGSLISHVDTKSVMMVETHEIEETDEDGDDSNIIITGRTLDFFLDYRVAALSNVGINNVSTDKAVVYNLPNQVTWIQLVELLNDQLLANASTWNVMIDIPNILITYDFGGGEAITEKDARIGQLSKAASELMDFADLGLVISRPNGAQTTMNFVVTKGFDKTETVQFDWLLGDVKKAKYLWTNKGHYNGIRVRGKYYSSTVYPTGLTGFDVRMRIIDEEKIDDDPTSMSGAQLIVLENRLKAYGLAELGRHKNRVMTNAVIAPNNRYVYRTDYDIGDLVYVRGNYGLEEIMRVTEFAEVEDENGQSSYPTVTVV